MHVVGTAGHVDHGKSALVKRLTGIDPDRLAEEQRRGLTIDLGFAWLKLPSGREVGIVDVPGHERFIKNMLAGAGGVSICLFVVAANEGWKPQSAEHLAVLEVLGVSSGVIAVTKADTVDGTALELVVAEVKTRLQNTALIEAPVIACSAQTGTGIDNLLAALDAVVGAAPAPIDEGRPRLWIDRAFSIAGAGTVVTGTLAGGRLEAGQDVQILGSGKSSRNLRARIRGLQTHAKDVPQIGPGNRAALNLAGVDRGAARRGDAVVTGPSWRVTGRVDAIVRVIPTEISGVEHVLTEKGAHLLYAGTAETPVRVRLLDAGEVGPGHSAFARIGLRDPLPLQRGDRFVLRDAGRVLTFGGGEVLDPQPSPARPGGAEHLTLLRRLLTADSAGALMAIVDATAELDEAEGLARAGLASTPRNVIVLGRMLVSQARFEELTRAAASALADHHRDSPLEAGISREALRAATGLKADSFDALLKRMEGVQEQGAYVRLPSHAVALSPGQQRQRARLLALLNESGPSPPLARDLDAGADLLKALEEAGDIVRVGDFYLSRDVADRTRAGVRDRIASSGPLTVAEIRDLLGTTRKYAVPLCEWLDGTGATIRRGDVRILGPRP